jgi:tRNA pseudouridine55 synthase
VGPATRLISLVQEQRKTYCGEFRLGLRSDTDDITGQVTIAPNAKEVSHAEIASALPRFLGAISQVPPQFSAVHVAGRRAYELARAGQTVKIEAKTVEVHRIELLSYAWPDLELEIECGSGTYVRAIGRDLGELLETGAVMTELVRTRIGPFELSNAVSLEDLNAATLSNLLLPASLAVQDLPKYQADDATCERLKQGKRIAVDETRFSTDANRIAILTSTHELAALAEFDKATKELMPRLVFLR